jgi:hypothetical protein
MPSVFFSYSHADEALRDQLEKHLSLLKRQGVITTWHDRRIGAGEEWERAIDDHIETDDIILLLISPDFLASDYCYDQEMTRAVERHDAGEATVIPVFLRPCSWKRTPFGKIQGTPPDARPVTQWPDRDVALLEVTKAIEAAAGRLAKGAKLADVPRNLPNPDEAAGPATRLCPPSSNIRLAKTPAQGATDAFQFETFEYVARFFESSLQELEARNPGVKTSFRRIDANRFTSVAYLKGQPIARCTIFTGAQAFQGVGYSASEDGRTSTLIEHLRVDADDQSIYLRRGGKRILRGGGSRVSQEGAAELLWGLFIQPLQQLRSR